MAKKYLFLILFLVNALSLFPQTFERGAILDPESYNKVPLKSATRSILPPSATIKDYSPVPESQGQYRTCVGWAAAFNARTTIESVGFNRIDKELILRNVFSPTHLYKSISDNEGKNGASIYQAMVFLRDFGAVRRRTEELLMKFPDIPITLFAPSERFPIKDFVRLFSHNRGVPGIESEIVPPVKRSISEGKPVVIGMNCPDSFNLAKGVWRPTETPLSFYGGHAMCVVGYDDNMYGGAFEIMNSWGTWWGNDGYIWITYRDFARFVDEAYEMIEDLLAYQKIAEFSGSVEIEIKGQESGMEVEFVNQGYYKTKKAHPSGTWFRYIMNCGKPANLYAFAADSNSYTRIFPADGYSAVLNYRENIFAFPFERPGEIDWLELDDIPGTDYLVVLFSKQPLDIDDIGKKFMSATGNFAQRVEKAVGKNYLRPQTAKYEKNRMEYTAQSRNENAVFGLLLAIEHRN
jgi:hypothetical protein